MAKRKKRQKRRSSLDFTVYTDGGCIDNPGGKGGFGAICVNHKTGEINTKSRGYESTTNNRMEMRAVIEGLRDIPKGSTCLVVSDSQLVVNCLSGLWERKKNLDLWDEMDIVTTGLNIRTKWVRGHNGDILNEVCDTLATGSMNGSLFIDEGYRGKKKMREETKGVELPESIDDSILRYDPEIDSTLSNKEGRENIKAFKEKPEKTFKDYTSLKTGGTDGWSSVSHRALVSYDEYGKDAWEIITKNIEDFSSRLSALRWFRRGLSIEDAIKKARVDLEVNNKLRNNL